MKKFNNAIGLLKNKEGSFPSKSITDSDLLIEWYKMHLRPPQRYNTFKSIVKLYSKILRKLRHDVDDTVQNP